MRESRYLNIAGAVAAALTLSACNDDLTRSEAENILNGVARGSACVSSLKFREGGVSRAEADSVVPTPSMRWLAEDKIADLPGGDSWIISLPDQPYAAVTRKINSNLCIPGHVEILSIADAPYAQANGSYKLVEFNEIIDFPAEIARLQPYVVSTYQKTLLFQKTDAGWRVGQ